MTSLRIWDQKVLIVGFSTSKAWYSRLIRWFTKSRCSHTFLLVKMLGELLVFQEGPLGWGAKSFTQFKEENTVVDLIPVEGLEDGFKKTLPQLGMPYGYLPLLGMFPVMVAKRLGWHMRNPLRGIHTPFCSARNAQIIQDSPQCPFYERAKSLDPMSTSPEDLWEFLQGR